MRRPGVSDRPEVRQDQDSGAKTSQKSRMTRLAIGRFLPMIEAELANRASQRTKPTMAKQGPRKKLPKELAVINADNCTGCEACLEVCPVDCIVKVQQYPGMPNLQSWCEIDIERCVGCEVCVRIARKKTDPVRADGLPVGRDRDGSHRAGGASRGADRRPAGIHPRQLGPAGRHGPAPGRTEGRAG